MLIDLSDTVNWKHTETGHCIIDYMIVGIDPASDFLGEIGFGFLTNVDATNGDFNRIVDIDLERKSDIMLQTISFGSSGFDCEIDHHFGPVTADSTLFQTDLDLDGPNGNNSFPSGNGDLVMIVEIDAGTVDVSVTLGYESFAS